MRRIAQRELGRLAAKVRQHDFGVGQGLPERQDDRRARSAHPEHADADGADDGVEVLSQWPVAEMTRIDY